MSAHNIKGMPFLILNDQGYYDLYDASGNKMGIPKIMIRVTQNVNDLDKMVIIAPVNVMKNEDEMKNLLTEWNK